MAHWLASPGDARVFTHIKRFDARFWTMNFPRPMMAAATTIAPDALRVDAAFYRRDDLAGLIWEAEDRWDHPLIAYETSRDFRGCRLGFRWRSGGVKALDALHGPTLTIEGRDANGNARAWYVRLWNYAAGTPDDAAISLDFDALEGGFLLPGESDPVWAGDLDRMFISLVAPGYDESDAPLAAPAEGWVELSEIACEGAGSTLRIGDTMVPVHGMRIATGFDDAYNLTPARVLRNALHLGYREVINHYVGMSHYYRLDGDLIATTVGGALNVACAAWHADFFERAKGLGYEVIVSLSYELFDAVCPEDWKQRDEGGAPALTGWVPPSTLLSPANGAAMGYLQAVARAFVGIAQDAGQPVRFQIGEPWWWITLDGEARICLYDDAARAAFGAGLVSIPTSRGAMTPAQIAMLDQAGAMLAASTAALGAAVRDEAPEAELLLLVYLPTVLDAAAQEAKRANVPIGWARPAFDVLQLEDYDWVIAGDPGSTARGIAAMGARLGYPVAEQHYFAGFVLKPEDAGLWAGIEAAAAAGRARGTRETFFWALPQATRDGFTHFDEEESEVQAFDDVLFPLALGREAMMSPRFSTAVVTTASGAEQRNSDWANARLAFDAGPGVRSEADVGELIAFFRARRGAARGFRFRDPFDDSSAGMTGEPGAGDQFLGMGDGSETRFALVKRYGDPGSGSGAGEADRQVRPITRPVAGSVRVEIDGVEMLAGWAVETGGVVAFDAAPAEGVEVRAGFRFDVPVRFAEDRLEVARATYLAGEAASVALVEVQE